MGATNCSNSSCLNDLAPPVSCAAAIWGRSSRRARQTARVLINGLRFFMVVLALTR